MSNTEGKSLIMKLGAGLKYTRTYTHAQAAYIQFKCTFLGVCVRIYVRHNVNHVLCKLPVDGVMLQHVFAINYKYV